MRKFSCPSYLPFYSCSPLKNPKTKLVGRISKKVSELEEVGEERANLSADVYL